MFFPPLTIAASTGDDGEANSSRITLRGGKHTGGWRVGGISKNMGRPKSCVSIKLLSCTFLVGFAHKKQDCWRPNNLFFTFIVGVRGLERLQPRYKAITDSMEKARAQRKDAVSASGLQTKRN